MRLARPFARAHLEWAGRQAAGRMRKFPGEVVDLGALWRRRTGASFRPLAQ